MEITKTHKFIASGLVVVILFGVYVYFDGRFKTNDNENKSGVTASTTAPDGSSVMTDGSGNYKIEPVAFNDGKSSYPMPDINRSLTVSEGAMISPESKSLAETKIKELQARIKSNNSDVLAWTDLGIYQKIGGDYAGAVLSWKYASHLSPTDYVSPANLANLYAYFMKDNAQAEIYYKQAVSKGPTQAYLYTQFAEFYRDVFKDSNKARELVNQGLAKIPGDKNLLQIQASLN